VFYNHFPSKTDSYVGGTDAPQFVFGFGLSYTKFGYSHLAVAAPAPGGADDVMVTFDVANTGAREGDEVAQLYVRQTTASVATPVKALKAFQRVHLLAGETKSLTLRVKQSDLAVWDANQQWKVEPAEYKVMVGGSSLGDLTGSFTLSGAAPGQPVEAVTGAALPHRF
jgi:beta-glucosidase